MNKEKPIAALFDFDGVVVDTEPQYTLFWDEKGKKYHPEIPNFGHHIKGQTLIQIYKQFFREPEGLQDEITRQLLDYELTMHFEYIDGVVDFMKELREKGVKLAIVTSSNDAKMANAYREHPELKTMVDFIVTADRVTHSKPHPECFLHGAEMLGVCQNRQAVCTRTALSSLPWGPRRLSNQSMKTCDLIFPETQPLLFIKPGCLFHIFLTHPCSDSRLDIV